MGCEKNIVGQICKHSNTVFKDTIWFFTYVKCEISGKKCPFCNCEQTFRNWIGTDDYDEAKLMCKHYAPHDDYREGQRGSCADNVKSYSGVECGGIDYNA